MTNEEIRSLVRRFYEVLWNRWDDQAVPSVLAEGFVFRGSMGTSTVGRDGWRSYRDTVRQGSPDFHNELVSIICEEDRAAARLVCSGHHAGPLLGIPGTGRSFRYDIAAFFTARDGLLSEAWVLGDLDGLRRQLA
jgi:steroid delta-isomerase-like uncharacterized protein